MVLYTVYCWRGVPVHLLVFCPLTVLSTVQWISEVKRCPSLFVHERKNFPLVLHLTIDVQAIIATTRPATWNDDSDWQDVLELLNHQR
jgi:hypothetical protein